ncbi:MAG: hypothetical protein ACJAZF_004601, partial [Granulosicoccus sp.]
FGQYHANGQVKLPITQGIEITTTERYRRHW